jgi:hypothetical protein
MEYRAIQFDAGRFIVENDLQNTIEKTYEKRVSPTARERHWDMPGFHGKARVSTTFGDLPIMGLRLRDKVRTISGEYKPVKWIDEIRLDKDFLESFPEAQPIRIDRGALGRNSPQVSILVSPAQKLSFKKEWSRPTSKSASDLLKRPKVFRTHESSISYFLFHCGEADVVQVDGVWCHVSPKTPQTCELD